MPAPTLLLVDGHSLLYRSYHAFPPLSTPSGEPINAVYGFTRILLTALRDVAPEYLAAAFDHRAPTFRHQQFDGYKAQRKPMPEDLIPQVETVKRVVHALGIPIFEVAGFEADDVIGTLATQAATRPLAKNETEELCALIMTGDRDAFQLVSERISILMPGKAKKGENLHQEYNRAAVKSSYGVWPEQVIDLKALMGDASDNIPGVAGIGAKTAMVLLEKYQTLDAVLAAADPAHPDSSLSPNVLKKLQAGLESARLSQQLATIDCHVPITLELDKCRVNGYDKSEALAIFQEFGFKSLQSLLPPDEFEQGVQAALF